MITAEPRHPPPIPTRRGGKWAESTGLYATTLSGLV
jgi:hypothetical protein